MDPLKEFLRIAAPALATAFGSPLAGVATKILADKLLGKPDATQDEVAAAVLSGGPDTLVKLRQAELEYQRALKQADIDLAKIDMEDRSSARQRETMTGDNITPRVLAAVVVGGFFTMIWAIFTKQVDIADPIVAGFFGTLLGSVLNLVTQVLNYYFGSSRGSAMKDQLLLNAQPAPVYEPGREWRDPDTGKVTR